MKNSVQRKLRNRFHVTPIKGLEFEGILIDSCREYHVFAKVTAYPDDVPQSVDGELYIERSNVAYMQLLMPRETV